MEREIYIKQLQRQLAGGILGRHAELTGVSE